MNQAHSEDGRPYDVYLVSAEEIIPAESQHVCASLTRIVRVDRGVVDQYVDPLSGDSWNPLKRTNVNLLVVAEIRVHRVSGPADPKDAIAPFGELPGDFAPKTLRYTGNEDGAHGSSIMGTSGLRGLDLNGEGIRMTWSTVLDDLRFGNATRLEGRGLNTAYRTGKDGGLLVKVHCIEESGEPVEQRLLAVDELMLGADWYSPLLDLGRTADGRLVELRAFCPGRPAKLGPAARSRLIRISVDLETRLGVGDGVLAYDYASKWLNVGNPATLVHVLDGRARLLEQVLRHLSSLVRAARRLTTDCYHVHHGDLQVRNLIVGSNGFTLVDWDEAALSARPCDAAKAFWLLNRARRGSFVLDVHATSAWLEMWHPACARANPYDLALLGALWFVPTQRHLELLARRNASHAAWYIKWVEEFWSNLDDNLGLLKDLIDAP